MNLQNKSVVLNIVLAIVVVVLSVRLASDKVTVDKSADAQQSVNAEQAVLDNIATRTSVRDYEARPVEKEKIEKMLRAAMAAPTAMNKQPWHFVVVDQRNVLDALAGANPYAKMLKKAPLAIVVCGNRQDDRGWRSRLLDSRRLGCYRKPSACSTRYGSWSCLDWRLSIRRALYFNQQSIVVARQSHPPQHDCCRLSGRTTAAQTEV